MEERRVLPTPDMPMRVMDLWVQERYWSTVGFTGGGLGLWDRRPGARKGWQHNQNSNEAPARRPSPHSPRLAPHRNGARNRFRSTPFQPRNTRNERKGPGGQMTQ